MLLFKIPSSKNRRRAREPARKFCLTPGEATPPGMTRGQGNQRSHRRHDLRKPRGQLRGQRGGHSAHLADPSPACGRRRARNPEAKGKKKKRRQLSKSGTTPGPGRPRGRPRHAGPGWLAPQARQRPRSAARASEPHGARPPPSPQARPGAAPLTLETWGGGRRRHHELPIQPAAARELGHSGPSAGRSPLRPRATQANPAQPRAQPAPAPAPPGSGRAAPEKAQGAGAARPLKSPGRPASTA